MRISVPASSANLGPGFDTLGVALDLPFVLSDEPDDNLLEADGRHPASVAFAAAEGSGPLWWRSPIPPGRGLGFSGAARVAGALMGCLQSGRDEAVARDRALEIACGLVGHPDNASASMLGGVVAAADSMAVRIAVPVELSVVVWWPSTETSTDKARSVLPATVPLADAVFNIGHTAVLVAALAAGDLELLGRATADRLHQSARLERSPASAAALEALAAAAPVAAWLSGSGPTVAAFTLPADAERVAGALAAEGSVRVLDIDHCGARVVTGAPDRGDTP